MYVIYMSILTGRLYSFVSEILQKAPDFFLHDLSLIDSSKLHVTSWELLHHVGGSELYTSSSGTLILQDV